MRISDWSSDVCSSDLFGLLVVVLGLIMVGFLTAGLIGRTLVGAGERILARMPVIRSVYSAVKQIFETVLKEQSRAFREVILFEFQRKNCWSIGFRSEEHTSELQSLMRISYAVYCLKKTRQKK